MNAKEMFKKLGYEHSYVNETFGYVGNRYIKRKSEYYGQEIMFNDCYKNYIISNVSDTELRHCGLEINEHQAIHQQMKELGWLDG